ncbi:hypothetical protein LY39_03392 [Roseinatronobacter bogoriensis subsp. barguzinensis]|nr:hypothetical protein LY39_03392 [Rhodobaca barguzinensis]TDY67072.1 hypothetical protein EV660_10873 [Rhodobaca bogoriensis DSM 18756]
MLGYALTLSDANSWEATSVIWQARLEPQECAALAWAALRSMEREGAMLVAETVLGGAGSPPPIFIKLLEDATAWAGYASHEELEAYALSIFQAFTISQRREFVEFVKGYEHADA